MRGALSLTLKHRWNTERRSVEAPGIGGLCP